MRYRTACVLIGTALVLSGCGTSQSGPAQSGAMPSGSASADTSPASSVSSSQAEPAPSGPSLDITIAAGTVTPTNATLEAQVGTPITVNVTSDATDELHVHAVPEYTFEVKAAPAQTFQFTVDIPGRVEVELHELHRTVATIQVRP